MDARTWKPETYPQVIPYLVVDDAGALMDFVLKVFDGVPADRVPGPDGQVQHGEVRIGASMVMVGRARTPDARTTSMVYVYVPDVDATYAKALAAGATAVSPPADQFYGDRSGGVRDPWGNQWWMATHLRKAGG
jgi:PhnB protein